MHAKSGLRVVLKWKIFRPDSVIAAVIPLWSVLADFRMVYLAGLNPLDGILKLAVARSRKPYFANYEVVRHLREPCSPLRMAGLNLVLRIVIIIATIR